MHPRSIALFLLTCLAINACPMEDAFPKEIQELLDKPIEMLGVNETVSDETLFAKNPTWKIAKQLPQEGKNNLLKNSEKSHRAMIGLVAAIGADPNKARIGRKTLLGASLDLQDYSLVLYLLEKGADPNQNIGIIIGPCKKGQNQCHPLEECRSLCLTELLIKYGAKIPANILCRGSLNAEIMEFYLKKGIRPEKKKNENDWSPFHWLALSGLVMTDRTKKAKLFIEADLNLLERGPEGNTALHWAARSWSRDTYCDKKVFQELCSTMVHECHNHYQKRKTEVFALLCCLKKLKTDLYRQKDLFKSYFLPASAHQLLTQKNDEGKIPYNIWKNEILNPEKYKPKN